ncbi:MAG: SWIM/SEC-C metal-binding protein [Candidatus Azotimanducaceae bacterium]|jgi:SWIM/SEC-C metal-binding protein
MPRYPHKDLPLTKSKLDGGVFGTKKPPRLGSKRGPLKLKVQDEARYAEIAAICADKGWFCDITVDAEADEDIRALTLLLAKQVIATTTRLAGRNDPCPCASGKKYKHCCGK